MSKEGALHPTIPKWTPIFRDDYSKVILDCYFGFINDTIWDSIAAQFSFVGTVPEQMVKYKIIQKEAENIFDLFYDNTISGDKI